MLTLSETEIAPETQPDETGPTVMEARPVQPPATADVRNATGHGRWRPHTFTCFALSILVIAVAIVLGNLGAPSVVAVAVALVGVALFGSSTVIALYRAAHGVAALVRSAPAEATRDTADAVTAILGNLFMAGFGAFIAYISTVGFSRGRQLRRFGRVLLPGLRSDPTWAMLTVVVDGQDVAPPTGVADQWRENGKTEHASVAAFARLTLDLMALGAPPSLVSAANRDALDEIRHTELCFSIARALDGKSDGPAPFPAAQRVATLPRSRTLALAKLAVDSLIDGALHEGVSARIIAKLSQRCALPSIRAALKEIAADEGRHTAHGWAVVDWCLDEGGKPVGEALLGAIRALPRQMHSERPAEAADGGWERWGIHGRDLESEEYAAAFEHVIGRVRAKVLEHSSEAA